MSERKFKYRLVKCSDEVPYKKEGMTSDEVKDFVNKFGSMSRGADPVAGTEEYQSLAEAKSAFEKAKHDSEYCRITDYPENKVMDIYSIMLEEVAVDEAGDEWNSDVIDWHFPSHEGAVEVEWKKIESFRGMDLYMLGKADITGSGSYEVGDVVCFPEGDSPELGYEEWVAGSVAEMHDFIDNENSRNKEKATSDQLDPKLKDEPELER